MTDDVHVAAQLLALAELVPADRRDLSELLKFAGDAPALLDADGVPGSNRLHELWTYLRTSVGRDRVTYWEQSLADLDRDRPSVAVTYVTGAGYPRLLLDAYDCPPVLFVEGSYAERDVRSLAIVGSRTAGGPALTFARAVAEACVANEITVVSGLAKGVDQAAHEGALAAGGRTIAVLPTGIAHAVYPPTNGALARRIATHGCLLSTFPPNAPATSSSFVARNAVISALAPVSLIVDASYRSGTYTEAEHALRQRREVMLWAPALSSAEWAQRLALEPGVSFVESVHEALLVALHAAPTTGGSYP